MARLLGTLIDVWGAYRHRRDLPRKLKVLEQRVQDLEDARRREEQWNSSLRQPFGNYTTDNVRLLFKD